MLGKEIDSNVYSSAHKFNEVNRLLGQTNNNLINHKSKPFNIWRNNEILINAMVGARVYINLYMVLHKYSNPPLLQIASPVFRDYYIVSYKNKLLYGTTEPWIL